MRLDKKTTSMKSLITLITIIAINLQAFGQQPVFVTTANGDLYSLNLINCSSRLVGSTGHGFADIAFTSNGKLWGIEGGNLFKIDTSDAVSTLIGFTGLQGVSLVSLNDTTLLDEYEKNLYSINTGNASTHLLGIIGYQASGDLTWYDNDLFMTAGDLLIKIVFNNTFTDILSASPVNKNGVIIPTCEGAVTVSSKNSSNILIGFSGKDVYKICQLDGTSQLLCSGIVPDGIPGGACLTLAPQNPKPTTCFTSKSQAPPLIRIIQNPFSSQTVIETSEELNDATLKVFNAIGQKVKELNHLTGQTITLSMTNFASGVYFIQLMNVNRKPIVDKILLIHN